MKIAATVMCVVIGLGISGKTVKAESISRGTHTFRRGYIESGEKFGVRIGEPIEHARKTLSKKGAIYDGVFQCSSEEAECDERASWDGYRYKKFFRDGTISIVFREGKVIAISWTFLPPII